MEERRLLTAVALSLLVLTAYSYLFPPPKRAPSLRAPTPASGVPPGSEPPPPAPTAVRETLPNTTPIGDERERRIEVDTGQLAVAFSNRGARLVSWQLKPYLDARGRPEEMVETARGGPRPLDLETDDPGLDERLRDGLYRPSSEALQLAPGETGTLSFEWSDGEATASKTFRFSGQGYLIELRASVRRAGREQPKKLMVIWGPGLGIPTQAEKEVQGYQAPQAVKLTAGAGGVERLAAEKLSAAQPVLAARFLGVESRYFAAVFVPENGSGSGELRALSLPAGEDGKPRVAALAALELEAPAAARLYVGPKDYAQLKALGYELEQIVPVGEWIGPIVVRLLALLKWVHGHVGNYGWSIVVLTVLINLVMAPFRHYSIANGRKMAKLGPELKLIQERYRKVPLLDPKRQEMNEEMGRLYARHGMNMSTQMTVGCLPLLLTMPFLIAFYRVLQVSIDLKGAPFLWIPDLSHKDPLFITPVLMGASMFLMQRLTPTAMDPAQRQIMMLMPVMLTVMFFFAPGGLNLYWLASNLCSIVQQGVTLRLLETREQLALARPKGEKRKP